MRKRRPARPRPAGRLETLIERTFRYSYMVATNMRDDMRAEGPGEEMEALVRAARGLQNDLLGGGSEQTGGRVQPNP